LVWGVTHGYNLDLFHAEETTNNISILRTIKDQQRPGDEATPGKEKDKSVTIVDVYSIPALEKLLDTMMPDAKTKVIKVPFSRAGRVYLSEQFNDL